MWMIKINKINEWNKNNFQWNNIFSTSSFSENTICILYVFITCILNLYPIDPIYSTNRKNNMHNDMHTIYLKTIKSR